MNKKAQFENINMVAAVFAIIGAAFAGYISRSFPSGIFWQIATVLATAVVVYIMVSKILPME